MTKVEPKRLSARATQSLLRRMTLKELAAALNVSPMTVSNAFNRPDRVAPATRSRVLAEAARLGYAGPDPTARSLRRGRVGAVGVLYGGPLSYAFSDPAAVLFLQGVSVATEAARLGLLLLSGAAHEEVAIVTEAAVDGIISFAMADDDPLLAAALARRVPLVLVDQEPRAGIACIGIDDQASAKASAAHVLAAGHRHIGIIAFGLFGRKGRYGPADAQRQSEITHPVARARLRGYAAAVEASGIAWAGVPVYEAAATTPAGGAEAAAWLLAQQPRPTALLAMSDQLALGALDEAKAQALRVPGDLAIVGFDDVPAAGRVEPALTTVRQPHFEKGRQAAHVLVSILEGFDPDDAPIIVLPTQLVIRDSTGAPSRG